MTNNQFKAGDRVLVNDGLVATITHYDPEGNWLSYESRIGGSTNTYSGHISNTKLELLSSQTFEEKEPELDDTRDGVTNVGANDGAVREDDEITGLGTIL